MSEAPTRLYGLIEERLDGITLADFIASRRQRYVSWRRIARELSEQTGVAVSSEAVRLWFADRIQIEVKVA